MHDFKGCYNKPCDIIDETMFLSFNHIILSGDPILFWGEINDINNDTNSKQQILNPIHRLLGNWRNKIKLNPHPISICSRRRTCTRVFLWVT